MCYPQQYAISSPNQSPIEMWRITFTFWGGENCLYPLPQSDWGFFILEQLLGWLEELILF